MSVLVSRAIYARLVLRHAHSAPLGSLIALEGRRGFSCSGHVSTPKIEKEKKIRSDPRINILGRAIEDDFATIRESYGQLEPAE